MENAIDWAKLAEPFPYDDLEWRVAQAGKTRDDKIWAQILVYVTNRAIQQRLDDVVTPAHWRNEYAPGPLGGMICGISIFTPPHGWVTKWDGAENTNIDPVKGGLSGAMKRAAVQWGIGRYLYGIGDTFANVHDKGSHRSSLPKDQGGDRFRWDAPPADSFPAWALPNGGKKPIELDNLIVKSIEAIMAADSQDRLSELADRLDRSEKLSAAAKKVLSEVLIQRGAALANQPV